MPFDSSAKSGFEAHGITHSSASQINLWANAPDVWIAQKLYGKRGPASAAMMRGICAEDAVAATLKGKDHATALKVALDKFDREMALTTDDKATKEREAIPGMVDMALEALKEFGEPEFPETGQRKVEVTCNGGDWKLPIIGFTDFDFDGAVVDLKTTLRIPSVMSKEHQRQRAIYARTSGNRAVKFLYCSPKKAVVLEDGDPAELLAEIKIILQRQERFLRLGDREALRSVVPVSNTFYWNGLEQVRSELYGL